MSWRTCFFRMACPDLNFAPCPSCSLSLLYVCPTVENLWFTYWLPLHSAARERGQGPTDPPPRPGSGGRKAAVGVCRQKEYSTCNEFSWPGGWNEQGESPALGSCHLLNQRGNTQSVQSQKGAEHGMWSLWRKWCRLQNGSKKSATGRRCVSHQKSLKCQNTYSHSTFLFFFLLIFF